MESIYRQFYDEPRFRPSPVTAVRFAGGLLGRKTGEGFYRYPQGQKQVPVEPTAPSLPPNLKVWLAPYHSVGHMRAAELLKSLGVHVAADPVERRVGMERVLRPHAARHTDRKSVVEGKSVSVRVDLGGRLIIKKQTKTKTL